MVPALASVATQIVAMNGYSEQARIAEHAHHDAPLSPRVIACAPLNCRIAGTATGIAKILFLVFLVLFIVSFIMGRRPKL